ncbi:sigma factor-like helix-turn-helix DNA-binding protein [Nakamurella sp. GG22]
MGADHAALMTARQALPPAQRVPIVFHHLADLPMAQVEAETGASQGRFKQHLFRGRAGPVETAW